MENIRKQYKGQIIIDGLQLTVERGRVVALCGGNGAGKSTILKMIAGISHPDSGVITVGGVQWKEDRERYASLLGYMPDDLRFGQGQTAYESLSFWGALRGVPKSSVREALRQVGLENTGKKPVTSFSKGMRQRLALAQALLASPQLVLMDEPTNGLDPYWMDTFVRIVKETASNGQTVLFSTHQLHIAEKLADRILFLKDGRIELDGSAADIRSRLGAERLEAALSGWFG
nr:ABC transporter ATP-binding protein [Paenibacillus turpanensis]